MKVRNVIFDLDGTLLNTIEDMANSLNYVLRSFDYAEYSIEQVKKMVGNGMPKLIERAIPQGLDNPKFQEIYNEYKNHYDRHCRIKTKPYDGILTMLEQLKEQGCQMAIVSNKNHKQVVVLQQEFFSSTIEVAVGQQDTTRKKPAPDTLLLAMKELNAKPDNTIYVGDSEVDKMTADAAAVSCVLVSWGFRDKAMLAGLAPFSLIDKPEQLLSTIL